MDLTDWVHEDGTPCPLFLASRERTTSGDLWWCTEHQQHLLAATNEVAR